MSNSSEIRDRNIDINEQLKKLIELIKKIKLKLLMKMEK